MRSVSGRWSGAAGRIVVALAMTLALVACGDDGTSTTPSTTPTTTTTTTTTLPPSTILIQGRDQLIQNRQLFIRDVDVPKQGRIDITVAYTYDDSEILFWLTDRKCSRQMFDNDACNYLTKSLSGPNPRTATASPVEPGTYTFFVSNDGPHDEQVTYRLELTP